jgi:hypothetical protein
LHYLCRGTFIHQVLSPVLRSDPYQSQQFWEKALHLAVQKLEFPILLVSGTFISPASVMDHTLGRNDAGGCIRATQPAMTERTSCGRVGNLTTHGTHYQRLLFVHRRCYPTPTPAMLGARNHVVMLCLVLYSILDETRRLRQLPRQIGHIINIPQVDEGSIAKEAGNVNRFTKSNAPINRGIAEQLTVEQATSGYEASIQ